MKYQKRKLHKLKFKTKVLILFLFILSISVMLDYQMRPLIKSVAASRAQIVSTTIINEAVLEELSKLDINYSELISYEKDNNNKIIAINTDIKKVNTLKTSVTLAIQEKISTTKKKELAIPIGTLTGTELFNGRGPSVPLKIALSGSVLTNFRSNFENGGINQTKHQLYLDISTNIFALIPGYPVTTAVNTNVLIAETIIVGDVPTFFAGKTPNISN